MSIDQLRDVKLITALITPFHEDGSINYDALPELIEHLLAHHTEALLLAGTTAESPTLTHDEELELFAAVQKIVNGRVPLIAGVGTNDTRDSIEFAKEVAKFGGFSILVCFFVQLFLKTLVIHPDPVESTLQWQLVQCWQ